jgi:ADP-ribosylation factor-like protein 2
LLLILVTRYQISILILSTFLIDLFFIAFLLSRGLDNAGKTSILKRFNGEDIDTISPTLGFNIKTLEHKKYYIFFTKEPFVRVPFKPFLLSSYKLNVWDVGGQKSIRSYWRNYFESTDALVWVVDSADKIRMNDCKQELHALLVEEVQPE